MDLSHLKKGGLWHNENSRLCAHIYHSSSCIMRKLFALVLRMHEYEMLTAASKLFWRISKEKVDALVRENGKMGTRRIMQRGIGRFCREGLASHALVGLYNFWRILQLASDNENLLFFPLGEIFYAAISI